MKEVESSNQDLVNNMQQIGDVMQVVVECVKNADTTTKQMVIKYSETASNVNKIEGVVEKLIEELGEGGFMGLQDIRSGMRVVIPELSDSTKAKDGYRGVVSKLIEEGLLICLDDDNLVIKSGVQRQNYCMRISVDNVEYEWKDIELLQEKGGKDNCYRVIVKSKPAVINRREYPRLTITHGCKVEVVETGKSYEGKMVNISANGFALTVKNMNVNTLIKQHIRVFIPDFPVNSARVLEGTVIRTENWDGDQMMGCRMLEDNMDVRDYVLKECAESR